MNITPDTVYNPKRTFVVQQANGNILVRGNLPLDDAGEFAYTSLNIRLGELIAGFDLRNYTLTMVSLIDNQGEKLDLQCEFNAFGALSQMPTAWPPVVHGVDIFQRYGTQVSGKSGSLFWMPIQGCSDAANCAAVEPAQYNFDGIVDKLASLMATQNKTVIYFACMNGHDRAGSLHAAYLMKHMGRSRDEAMNQPPPKGAMAMKHDWKETYKPLIEWYASTLGK